MGTLPNSDENADLAGKPEPILEVQEESRRRRVAALRAAEGLWNHRTDIPKDGVKYQDELRAEWR